MLSFRNIMQWSAGKKKMAAAVAGGALLAMLLLLLVLFLLGRENYAVVYAKGSESLYVAAPKGQLKLQAGESKAQWFSPDGRRLFYDAGGALLLCEVKKGRNQPIAEGITQWAAAEGFAVYIEESGKRLQCYDVRRETAQALASGVEQLYAANGQGVFFFTKSEGEGEALFRCEMGGQPERVAGAVRDIHLYDNEVFYLAQSPTGEKSLHKIELTGGAVFIESNVAEVFWDDYQPGGNLYFLVRGQRQAAAQIQIDDPQEESDKDMKEPQQRDFSRLPFIGRLLGDGGYGDAMEEYRKKQERDQVRALAAELLLDLPGAGGGRDCYVFDGERARLLAKDVGSAKNGVAALRPEGDPVIVYKKEFFVALDAPRQISLHELVAAFRENGSEAMLELLAALQNEEGTEDLGYTLAKLGTDSSHAPEEIAMEQGFGRGDFRAMFLRGTDELLYFERDTAGGPEAMYTFTLTAHGVSERRLADTHVQDTLMTAQGLYYRKNRDLMRYTAGASNGASARILQNASAYIEGADGTLYILGSMQDDAGTLYAYNDNKQEILAGAVKLGSVVASKTDGYAAWLANWSEGAGELYTGKKMLDTNVTDIILVR